MARSRFRASISAYRLLLLLYPRAFRTRFGHQMCEDFRELLAANQERGFLRGRIAVWTMIAKDMAKSVPRERLSNFDTGDQSGGPRVAILNKTAAEMLWPGDNPIGKHLSDGDDSFEVIGVRIALGADNRSVRKIVLTDGLKLVSVGLGIGLPIAFGAAVVVRSMLYGMSPADPVTFGGIVVLFVAVGLLASYVPARRATKTDPIVALRCE